MERIILYGIGKRGKGIYEFLKSKNYEDYIYGFCDERARDLKVIDGKKVYHPDELASEANIVYCLTPMNGEIKRELRDKLVGKKCIEFSELAGYIGVERVEFNRQFCAYYHQDMMDDYFERAEDGLDVFWNENSEFYKKFKS